MDFFGMLNWLRYLGWWDGVLRFDDQGPCNTNYWHYYENDRCLRRMQWLS